VIEPLEGKLKDFRAFLYLAWQQLNLPEPTPVQYDIAQWLQWGPKRKIIQAFRGVGKSWVCSAYVLWRLRMDQQLNFMIVSASKERADSFSTFCMRLMYEMPLLQCLLPESHQRNSKIAFDVCGAEPDHAPSVKSVGITGQMTGSRADEIIADDIEVMNNSMTQPLREKLGEQVKEFDAILKPLPTSRITYLGTPQTEMSIYNTLANERGYVRRIWPVLYPHATLHPYGDALAPEIQRAIESFPELQGTTVEPTRFTQEDLMEREASYGRSGFALQFLLNTSLSDSEKYPLKCSDAIVTSALNDEAPEVIRWSRDDRYRLQLPCVGLKGDAWYGPRYDTGGGGGEGGAMRPYSSSWMSIDPSGRGTDETSYAIGKGLNGYVWVVASGGFQEGYTDGTLEGLVRLAKKHGVNKVVIEENFGSGMFKSLIEPHFARLYPVTIEEVRSSRQKEHRIIDTLEPLLNQHRLVFDTGVVERDLKETRGHYQLFYQMTHITREKGSLGHDDRLDALAMLCACFVEDAKLDAEVQRDRYKERKLEEELRGFVSAKRAPVRIPEIESLRAPKGPIRVQRGPGGKTWCQRGA
jgi:hypothetical protein